MTVDIVFDLVIALFLLFLIAAVIFGLSNNPYE